MVARSQHMPSISTECTGGKRHCYCFEFSRHRGWHATTSHDLHRDLSARPRSCRPEKSTGSLASAPRLRKETAAWPSSNATKRCFGCAGGYRHGMRRRDAVTSAHAGAASMPTIRAIRKDKLDRPAGAPRRRAQTFCCKSSCRCTHKAKVGCVADLSALKKQLRYALRVCYGTESPIERSGLTPGG